jgi:putative endonuclease
MSPRPPRLPRDWADPRHRLGFTGEEEAIGFLTALGWEIKAHRFRIGRNDIDLVARKAGLVAFVEVKTRCGGEFGPGRLSVGWKKRRAIARVAEIWRLRYGVAGDVYRFDVLEVIRRPGESSAIEYLEDAWRGSSW